LAEIYSDTVFEECKNRIGLNGTAKMGIRNFSEDVLLADLPSEELQIGDELKSLNEIIITKSDSDVVIDFSKAEIVTSSDLSNLLALRALLREHGRQLILCSLSAPTKGIFTVAGLDAVFEFASDKYAALAAIQHTKSKPTHTHS
jgi:anti-anti-sigma regulatory factor